MVNDHRPLSDHFWPQFGFDACPRFDGQRVLEIGFGSGARAFEVASHGACRLLGLDPLPNEVRDASARRDAEFPHLASIVEFRLGTIADADDGAFDVIVSESAFEHVMNLDEVLAQMRRKLAPGGRAYIAFGPLYHSPWGDHGWLRAALPWSDRLSWPWGHLLLPQRVLLTRLHRLKGLPLYTQTRDWAYLDLNQLTVHDYERLFRDSGLDIVHVDTNIAFSRVGKTVRWASRALPPLRKYLTFNMCAVLARPVD